MKSFLKRVAGWLLVDYQWYRMYYRNLADIKEPTLSDTVIAKIESPDIVSNSSSERIRNHAHYAGEHALGFGVWENDDLVSTVWYWVQPNHRIPKSLSNLGPREALLVDVLTAESARGKSYAVALIAFSSWQLKGLGYERARALVWETNTPSIRAFTKAGWIYEQLSVQLTPKWIKRKLSFKLRPRGSKGS